MRRLAPSGVEAVAGVLAGIAALAVAALASADPPEAPRSAPPALYRWTDAEGVVRYTALPQRVPAGRAHTLLPVEAAAPAAVAGPPAPAPIGPPPQASPPVPPEPSPQRVAADGVATAAPPVRAARARRWAVQLRSTPAGANAEALPAVALRDGERLYRADARVEGALWSRVRVGFFASAAAAEEARARLEREYPEAWVAPVDAEEEGPRVAAEIAAEAPRPPGLSYAIQLRAIPTSEAPGALPELALPPGSQLYWSTHEHGGRSWRRLRLGDFATLAQARAARARVVHAFPGAWIAPIAVGERHRSVADEATRGDDLSG